jgi:hypothetical protein
MSDPLLDPILERIARSQQATIRLGAVTVIDATDASLTVSLAGDVVTGVRWIESYAPVVADVVVVSQVGSTWVCLGKLSKQLGVASATVTYHSVTILPATTWLGRFASDEWFWSVAADGVAGQGLHHPYEVAEQLAGVWYLPGVGFTLPTGATVTSAKLRLTRWAAPVDAGGVGGPESTLVTPRLRLHAYSSLPGIPAWVGAVWAPGTLSAGQSAQWDIPSSWLIALLAGTATGVAVSSEAAVDYTWFSGVQIQISYTTPA